MNQPANRTDKIVVVDDDARIRDLLRRYLSQEGFEVIVAEDAKALSRIMLRDAVDLIVLDLMMPGKNRCFSTVDSVALMICAAQALAA